MLETQEALEELRRRWEAQPLAEVGAGGDVYCFYSFPWHSMASKAETCWVSSQDFFLVQLQKIAQHISRKWTEMESKLAWRVNMSSIAVGNIMNVSLATLHLSVYTSLCFILHCGRLRRQSLD